MEKFVPLDAMTKIVEVLSPLSSEDRARVIRAALALLGDTQSKSEVPTSGGFEADDVEIGVFPSRAKSWMSQQGVSATELQQIFHLEDGVAEFIACRLAYLPSQSGLARHNLAH